MMIQTHRYFTDEKQNNTHFNERGGKMGFFCFVFIYLFLVLMYCTWVSSHSEESSVCVCRTGMGDGLHMIHVCIFNINAHHFFFIISNPILIILISPKYPMCIH